MKRRRKGLPATHDCGVVVACMRRERDGKAAKTAKKAKAGTFQEYIKKTYFDKKLAVTSDD